jgi:Amt family ammonium transporter
VWVKKAIGYDDSLDAWGVHGVGGALGAIMTGMFAKAAIEPATYPKGGWLTDGNFAQMIAQFKDVGAVFVYCAIVTFIILKAIDLVIGLRVSAEVEVEGLDINLHGETVHD